MMEPESNEESPPGLPWLPRYWELECPVQQHLMEAAMCLKETGRYEDLWLQNFSSFKSCVMFLHPRQVISYICSNFAILPYSHSV